MIGARQRLSWTPDPRMADSSEPKKETVKITVTPSPKPAPASQSSVCETVRIQLPTRPPPSPPPPIEPPSPAPSSAAAMPAPLQPQALKKEMARITVLSDPPPKPAMEMKKTQRLIGLPKIAASVTRVTVTAPPMAQPQERALVDSLPMPLCWTLVAASAATLILQIWNYLS